MAIREKRSGDKNELRQKILDAARDLFVGRGFGHVSMRKIAEQIGYSPTTIYLHFEDKADLLDCICEETLARLVRSQDALDQAISDPLDRLRRGLRDYIEFGLEHPDHYKVVFMMSGPLGDLEHCPRARAMGQKAFDHLRRTLRQCGEEGRLEVADLESTAQAIWMSIHGLTSLLIAQPGFPWVDRGRLTDTLIEQVVRGAGGPAAGHHSSR